MNHPTTKRPYVPPRIVRVRLTHEQAVLSACSVSAIAVNNNSGLRCSAVCKKQSSGAGRDDTNTS